MSKKNERHFRKANKCYIGNKSYSEKDIWVRDDCHVIGEYKCINVMLTEFIMLIFTDKKNTCQIS